MEAELISNEPAAPAPEPSSEPVPSEQPAAEPEAPAADAPVAEPAAPTEPLYKLPDGRMVNAETLQREWQDNFLPDYTRKSQTLAEIMRAGGDPKINNRNPNVPEWQQPDYVPKTYAEVIEIATQEAIAKIHNDAKAESDRVAAITNQIEAQVNEIKSIDPKLDENALFTHATKYGFNDLKLAYANMSEMNKVRNDTETKVLRDVKQRQNDPISQGGVPAPAENAAVNIGKYGRAVDFFRSLNK